MEINSSELFSTALMYPKNACLVEMDPLLLSIAGTLLITGTVFFCTFRILHLIVLIVWTLSTKNQERVQTKLKSNYSQAVPGGPRVVDGDSNYTVSRLNPNSLTQRYGASS